MIFMGAFSLFEGYMRGANVEPRWHEIDSAWSCSSWLGYRCQRLKLLQHKGARRMISTYFDDVIG
jgi:hypothetical protein